MDNNKDFIHIDELFRKLRDTVQEEYRSEDAWSRMKNILDEEMPVADPGRGIGKRRYFIPLLALLLGMGGATAGYYVYQNHNDLSGIDVTNTPSAGKSDASSQQAGDIYTAVHNNSQPASISLNAVAENYTASTLPQSHQGNGKPAQEKAGSRKPGSAGTPSTVKSPSINSDQSAATIDDILQEFLLPADIASYHIWQRSDFPQMLTSNTASLVMNSTNELTNDNPNVEKLNNKVELLNNPKAGLTEQPSKPNDIPVVKTHAAQNETPFKDKHSAASDILERVEKDNKNYVKKEDGKWYEEKQETVNVVKLSKKEDAQKNIIIDTQSIEKSVVVKHLPVDESVVTDQNITNNLSGSAAAATMNNFTDLKVLNESKIKTFSGEDKGSSFFKKHILRDDIYKLFNKMNKFEAMVNFGGHYAPAATGAYGFHIGVGGLYNITERLDIGLEARYVRKSFSNFYQDDEQRTYNVSQSGSLYSGTETITQYEYTIRNYNSIELPLYLSYKIGDRLSVMGGIQYVYAAPIKWQLSTNTIINDNFASVAAPQNKNTIVNQVSDFSARSGFGFTAGVGFDASRRISLDFRVSQNFYNQSNSTNNSINSIYNAPVFGFTFGYFFGKKDKIYYLMQKK